MGRDDRYVQDCSNCASPVVIDGDQRGNPDLPGGQYRILPCPHCEALVEFPHSEWELLAELIDQ